MLAGCHERVSDVKVEHVTLDNSGTVLSYTSLATQYH